MQYAPGFIAPITSSTVGSASSTAGLSSTSSVASSGSPTTLSAVNNIMTALVGNAVPASSVTPSQVVSTTMSGALGNSIGSLLKSADNKLDMSSEEWAQEVLEHQESTELQNQEFAQRMRKEQGTLGTSGFAIPGFDDPEMHNLINGE
ncbi:MAG: hypothetical protein Q4F00_03205 [bacterium]|nr:hypothetical protein [bacterium]